MPVGVIFPVLAKEFAGTVAMAVCECVHSLIYIYIFATVGSRLSPLPDVCVCDPSSSLRKSIFAHANFVVGEAEI